MKTTKRSNYYTTWSAETIRRGDLRPNVTYYKANPLTGNVCPSYHTTCADDDTVWIMYNGEFDRRSMILPEAYDRPVGATGLGIVAGIVNRRDSF
jgi:hypothetical protein